jgi:hypothetical protein
MIYEALGVDPAGSLSVVEPPADVQEAEGAEPPVEAAADAVPEEQAA